jgi:diguanylate cyclase (GGDEF)-like protein/PAS domain S-box-containing protein
LFSHWDDVHASDELREKYREQQLSSVMRVMRASACTNAIALCILVSIGWSTSDQTSLLVWAAITFAAIVANIPLIRRFEASQKAHSTSGYHAQIKTFTWLCVVNAFLFTVYPATLFWGASGEGRLIIACIFIAFLSNGSLVLVHLPQTAIPWVITFSFGGALGLLGHRSGLTVLTSLALVWYGFVQISNVLSVSKSFLEGLQSKFEVERQKQVVGLLLNDFESSSSDWLWEIDQNGLLQHVSVRLTEVTGVNATLLLQRPFLEVLQKPFHRMSRDEHEAYRALETCLARQDPFRNVAVPILTNTQTRWFSLTAKPLRDHHNAIIGWRGVASDVTEARAREREMFALANIDTLTMIANRRCFQRALDEHFATDVPGECTLILLDLDHFKTVNDSLGHQAGDALLRIVTRRFQTQIHEPDLLARLGGDEFAVLIRRSVSTDEANAIANTLIATLHAPVLYDDHRITASMSVGISSAPRFAHNAVDLLKTSDMALYAAKAAGRGTTRMYRPELEEAAQRKHYLASTMRQGLLDGQFVVHYQPQVNARTKELRGFEALVRWQHPTLGLIPPLDFIFIAEETGFIVELGAWVLRTACHAARSWPEQISVSVNLSAAQFRSNDLFETVASALSASGITPQRLELELTESVLVEDFAQARTTLNAIRALQVRIALDDFGTGFSSLSYLRKLPLDRLKIDRSFVSLLDKENEREHIRPIVQAIIQLAEALTLQTTAEGAETEGQRHVLCELGCDDVQGWLTGKPMEESRANALVHERITSLSLVDGSRLSLM